MKEIYSKPIAEIEKFQSVDILTTSGETVTTPGTDEGQGGIGGWI